MIQRKTPVPESHFNKFAGLHLGPLLEKRPQCRCFPVNFELQNFQNTFFVEHLSATTSGHMKKKVKQNEF